MNFMNDQKLTPTFMALFCDEDMRKGLKGLNEEQVNSKLD